MRCQRRTEKFEEMLPFHKKTITEAKDMQTNINMISNPDEEADSSPLFTQLGKQYTNSNRRNSKFTHAKRESTRVRKKQQTRISIQRKNTIITKSDVSDHSSCSSSESFIASKRKYIKTKSRQKTENKKRGRIIYSDTDIDEMVDKKNDTEQTERNSICDSFNLANNKANSTANNVEEKSVQKETKENKFEYSFMTNMFDTMDTPPLGNTNLQRNKDDEDQDLPNFKSYFIKVVDNIKSTFSTFESHLLYLKNKYCENERNHDEDAKNLVFIFNCVMSKLKEELLIEEKWLADCYSKLHGATSQDVSTRASVENQNGQVKFDNTKATDASKTEYSAVTPTKKLGNVSVSKDNKERDEVCQENKIHKSPMRKEHGEHKFLLPATCSTPIAKVKQDLTGGSELNRTSLSNYLKKRKKKPSIINDYIIESSGIKRLNNDTIFKIPAVSAEGCMLEKSASPGIAIENYDSDVSSTCSTVLCRNFIDKQRSISPCNKNIVSALTGSLDKECQQQTENSLQSIVDDCSSDSDSKFDLVYYDEMDYDRANSPEVADISLFQDISLGQDKKSTPVTNEVQSIPKVIDNPISKTKRLIENDRKLQMKCNIVLKRLN